MENEAPGRSAGDERSQNPSNRANEPEALIGAVLLATSTDCIKLLDLDGSLAYMSEAGRKLLEIEPGQIPIGAPYSELWPHELRGAIDDAIQTAAAGRIVRYAGRCPTIRGAARWWDVAFCPIKEVGGQIIGILCVARDITDHKRTEHSLLESEQRFRAIADNMAQLAWLADASGDIVWLNKRWIEFTGSNLEDLRREGWRRVHHPDYVEHVERRVRAAFRNRETWEDVVPLRGANGDYRWFLTRAVPVLDERGRPALWCATHTDITERRNLGHRLRQLARVIELSHEAMLVWDLEDGIVLWNRGCEELYGYRRSEAVGRTSHDLLATGHPGGMEAFMHALRHDGEWSGELCHTASDGEQVWVESRQELIRAGGRDLVLETNRDITERRKSDAIRNLLVAELNHRVKNTLAIVQSLAAQTARTQPDMASFMTSFTGRLQSLAAAQTILSDAQWAGASLRDLVISQLATTIGSDRQTQLSGADVFLPPQPALQLTLILHELATNAVQHGALTRPTGHVEITWSVGPGPKPEVALDWIESGGPEVSASAGKGLGRELIERLGRLPHLRARLELARDGVRCRVTTRTDDGIASGLDGYFDPTREGTAGAMRSRRRRPRSESGRRILVVEENALDALLIEEALADAGYLVIGPLRSREAVERALADHTFDLAIVDIDSVAIGGQGIAEGMIARGIPCIPVTARPDSDPADAPPAGETLRKPIGCAQLLALVSGRLRSK